MDDAADLFKKHPSPFLHEKAKMAEKAYKKALNRENSGSRIQK